MKIRPSQIWKDRIRYFFLPVLFRFSETYFLDITYFYLPSLFLFASHISMLLAFTYLCFFLFSFASLFSERVAYLGKLPFRVPVRRDP